MKKQLSVFALAAASVAIGMSSAYAAAPVVQFDPNTISGGTGADTITISGNIPEFIEFTTVDNNIELGNIAGPTFVGTAVSVDGRRGDDPANGTVALTKNTDTAAGLGDAVIEFRANSYIRVKFAGLDVRNVGPDGISGNADDYVLPTSYRVAIKGKVIEYNKPGSTGPEEFNGPGVGSTGQNPSTGPKDYASYTGAASTAIANGGDRYWDFKPGAPLGTGAPGPQTDPNAPSGFRVMAEVERHGLNDYHGDYSSQLNLTYYKY